MLTRKEFCRLGGAFALAGRGLSSLAADGNRPPTPAARTPFPNYWCTWESQGRLAAARGECRTAPAFAGDQGAHQTRDMLNEQILFKAPNWASSICEEFRRDLFLVLDDGWDVPYGSNNDTIERFGFLEPWPERFPGCGKTALERLTTICARIRDAGWQGTGVWVAAQRQGDKAGVVLPGVKDFFRRKLELSAQAGVRYWKVDWGMRSNTNEFRCMISELAREICPDMIIEHCPQDMRPLNGQEPNPNGEVLLGSGRCEASLNDAELVERLRFTDVFRTYDITPPFTPISTLDRAVAYSRIIDAHRFGTRLNVEDDPVIAAVLGHAFGIMRATRKVEDAAEWLTYRRVTNWHRMAPPFGGRAGLVTHVSDEALFASHRFRKNEHWYQPTWDHVVRQGAPAVVARGTALPMVKPRGDSRPYVLAGRNPSGALSVGTLPRVWDDGSQGTPSAEITLAEPLEVGKPLAVFGSPAAVHVPFKGRPVKVRAADLADGAEREIGVSCSDGFLHLDAETLRTVCAAHPQGTLGAVFRVVA